MRLQMYSIFDTVSQVFHKPFTAHNDGDAIRAFSQATLEHAGSNKNDYVLYHVGEWNDAEGLVVGKENPLKIQSGFDIKDAVA